MLPTLFRAPGAGVVVTRSDWTKDATLVAIAAGATRESHQDRAQGGFMLYRGGWLAAPAKITTHSGLAQGVNDACCVEIGSSPQAWTQDTAKLTAVEDRAAYTYAVADLAGAYTGLCTSYRREYFFLKPNVLFVRDVLGGVATGVPVAWHLHTGGLPPTIEAIGFRAQGAGARLLALGILPDLPNFSVLSLTNDRDPGVVGYRVDLDDQGKRQFLVALEAAPLSQQVLSFRDWEVDGLVGAWSATALVAWPQTDGPWSYVSPVAGPHYICGVAPGASYLVSGVATTASAAGVLSFTATRSPVTITAGGTPVPPPPPPPPPPPDPTRRTWDLLEGHLVTADGQTINLTGGQLVVRAIPGDPEPEAVPKPRGRKGNTR